MNLAHTPQITLNMYMNSFLTMFFFSIAFTAQEKVLLLPVELHQSHNDERQYLGCEEQVVEVRERSQNVGTEAHVRHSDHEPLPRGGLSFLFQ